MPTQEQIQAAINVMNDHGIDFRAPWECTLDDREQERFEALRDAIDAAHPKRPKDDGVVAWRNSTIEECARELETSYPDHAWLNAACAAIRGMKSAHPPSQRPAQGGMEKASDALEAAAEAIFTELNPGVRYTAEDAFWYRNAARAALRSAPQSTGCICQDQHRRGYCTEPGCPYATAALRSPYACKMPEGYCACIGDENKRSCQHSYLVGAGWRSVKERLDAIAPAVENLALHQEQCDMDGVMVKVSRQALDEVLETINQIAISGGRDATS